MHVVLSALLAAGLVVNGGFEDGSKGWNVGSKVNRVEAGGGLGRTVGLVWENNDPNVYQFATQPVALEPGYAYAFSGWVKAENVKNASRNGTLSNLSIEWRNDKGRFLAMAGSHAVVDNQEQEEGWVKFVGQTPVMPSDLGGATVVCSALRGSVGKVTFDNIEVKPLAARPILHLVSSAYRDMATDGEVTFVARCALNRQRSPLETLTAHFRLVGQRDELRRTVKIGTDGVVRTTVGVAELAFGEQPVRFEILRKDGSLLAAREMTFTRVDRLPSRKVAFDARGRTLVDGKPFFPLGLYSSHSEAKDLDIYCEGPFNCILPYAIGPDPKELDPYHAKGLKVIVPVCNFSGFRGSKLRGRFDERAYTARYLKALKGHPALFAWYLADELDAGKADDLRERNLQIRAADPAHPTYIVLDKQDRPADFIEGFDVIGMDPYPIGNGADWRKTGRMATCSTFPDSAKALTYGFRPQWQVPQTFDWAWHRPWATKDEDAHMPTLAELRNMNWQAIASGANGLVGWWFPGMVRNLRDKGRTDEFVRVWGDVKAAYREVAEKVPLLLSVEPAPKVAKRPANISARCWRKDGKLWLLAVNRTYDPTSGTVELSDGKQLEISLDGLGSRFVEVADR